MSSRIKKTAKERLSGAHKKQLDSILSTLSSYLRTPDGAAFVDQLQGIVDRIEERRLDELLTMQERQALQFITNELDCGRHPSARKVARALGFTSSRTGFQFIRRLADKGLLPKKR